MKKTGTLICVSTLYAVGIVAILGSGGGTPTVHTFTFWGKDGYTYEQAKTYHAQCTYDVGIQKFESRAEKDELIAACMEKDGFRLTRYTE